MFRNKLTPKQQRQHSLWGLLSRGRKDAHTVTATAKAEHGAASSKAKSPTRRSIKRQASAGTAAPQERSANSPPDFMAGGNDASAPHQMAAAAENAAAANAANLAAAQGTEPELQAVLAGWYDQYVAYLQQQEQEPLLWEQYATYMQAGAPEIATPEVYSAYVQQWGQLPPSPLQYGAYIQLSQQYASYLTQQGQEVSTELLATVLQQQEQWYAYRLQQELQGQQGQLGTAFTGAGAATDASAGVQTYGYDSAAQYDTAPDYAAQEYAQQQGYAQQDYSEPQGYTQQQSYTEQGYSEQDYADEQQAKLSEVTDDDVSAEAQEAITAQSQSQPKKLQRVGKARPEDLTSTEDNLTLRQKLRLKRQQHASERAEKRAAKRSAQQAAKVNFGGDGRKAKDKRTERRRYRRDEEAYDNKPKVVRWLLNKINQDPGSDDSVLLGGIEAGNGALPGYALSRFRLTIVWFVVLLSVCFLVGRLLWIQVLHPERLIAEADNRIVRNYSYEPARGLITDRNGKILALSVPVKSIFADAKAMNEGKVIYDPELLRKIATILDIEPQELFDKVKNPSRRHVRLKQYLPLDKARELSALDVPGLIISDNYQRYYPTGEINAHLVGILNANGDGVYGVEQSFNQHLSAQASKKQARKDLSGHVIENISVLEKGKPGGNLVLSIDDRLQTFAYGALQDTVIKHEAAAGSLVMMDVKTGEVLVMVNYPSFDPNDRSVFDSEAARNRAITDTFEPGSTIKPIVALAALETGEVTWTETFDTRPYYVNNKIIRDSHRMDTGTLLDIIKHSSNIGMAHISQRVGPEYILQMLERFGFGSSTNSGLIGEVNGNINSSRTFWSELDKATLGFGYGITVTALQMASAYSTMANYGARLPVSILRTVDTPHYAQVANINEIRRMHTALETVVSQGSGGRAAIDRYRIAGKTGTAHIVRDGSYVDDYVSSFAGFAPLSNPRFALIAVVFSPQQGSYYGGAVSAPVFRDVMTRALQLYNIPPDKE
ncbi:MAG: hypothetical protein H9847_04555 [Candidatus Anaerobiospirillum pullicola]|uniref:Uncharacterized protein n=1 Tax=Candidatus Anaerobiospirillum pullicola TaxID=2838451 RepID=A0A948TFT5_9GAMM|nr:hypothetical protein [Candidatus Anaerobiospirillum pullicola]